MQKFMDFMKLAGALTWRDIREAERGQCHVKAALHQERLLLWKQQIYSKLKAKLPKTWAGFE